MKRRAPMPMPSSCRAAIRNFMPGRLAANRAISSTACARPPRGARSIYGECGGYMTLGAGLVDAAGTRHEMAGLLPVETSFAMRKLHLGYRQATLVGRPRPLQRQRRFRGHEFHYASIVAEGEGTGPVPGQGFARPGSRAPSAGARAASWGRSCISSTGSPHQASSG